MGVNKQSKCVCVRERETVRDRQKMCEREIDKTMCVKVFHCAFARSLRPSHIFLTHWQQEDLLTRGDANNEDLGKTLPVRVERWDGTVTYILP